MIGMLTAFLLLSGQTAAPVVKDDAAKVDSVTVTATGKKPGPMPPWSRKIEGIGWPFLGVGEDKTVMMFAKTGKTPTGEPYQRVWVRHEFRLPQSEAGLTFRSERLAQDVDCKAKAFRSLAVYRGDGLQVRREWMDQAGGRRLRRDGGRGRLHAAGNPGWLAARRRSAIQRQVPKIDLPGSRAGRQAF